MTRPFDSGSCVNGCRNRYASTRQEALDSNGVEDGGVKPRKPRAPRQIAAPPLPTTTVAPVHWPVLIIPIIAFSIIAAMLASDLTRDYLRFTDKLLSPEAC